MILGEDANTWSDNFALGFGFQQQQCCEHLADRTDFKEGCAFRWPWIIEGTPAKPLNPASLSGGNPEYETRRGFFFQEHLSKLL